MSTRALTRPVLSPSLFDDFFKPWNEWFENSGFPAKLLTVPAVNVTEDASQYRVSLAVPGLNKDDFHIDVEGNMLTIESEKEETGEEKEGKYTRKEYSYSSFSRSFNLPEDVKLDSIDAHYKDGVLTITLPRMETTKKITASKQIVVK
ncbi:MAG: Hsp20/alpha crystallin family protein [Flavisolibacter sp.]